MRHLVTSSESWYNSQLYVSEFNSPVSISCSWHVCQQQKSTWSSHCTSDNGSRTSPIARHLFRAFLPSSIDFSRPFLVEGFPYETYEVLSIVMETTEASLLSEIWYQYAWVDFRSGTVKTPVKHNEYIMNVSKRKSERRLYNLLLIILVKKRQSPFF